MFLKRGKDTHFAGVKVANENTVVVGRDMRPHSPSLAAALIEGLRSTGIDVIDVGMIDTSFIYYAVNAVRRRRRHPGDGQPQPDPITTASRSAAPRPSRSGQRHWP